MRFRLIVDRALMRRVLLQLLSGAIVLFGGNAAAQDTEHGQRLAERWCTECHAVGSVPTRINRAPPFAAIAAKLDISADMIASFLLLPHATMPNSSLSRKDAEDIAAFIMDKRK
jgi:mono/diheme cytochrome c family protein